jgi:hypothetical protein
VLPNWPSRLTMMPNWSSHNECLALRRPPPHIHRGTATEASQGTGRGALGAHIPPAVGGPRVATTASETQGDML